MQSHRSINDKQDRSIGLVMEKMQFAALVLMTMLTIKLLVLPRWAVSTHTMSTVRWLMAGGTALLGVQFLLQFTLQLRTTGHINQAIMLNLALFIPCSALISLAVLYLQRRGRITHLERFISLPIWALAMILIAIGIKVDGGRMDSVAPTLKQAEIVASSGYALMQFFYSIQSMREMRRIKQAIANYYDEDMDSMLQWMQLSIVVLTLMAVLVPIMIFGNGSWLAIFGLLVFGGLFYLVDSFCLYAVSSAPAKVQEAEESEDNDKTEEKMDNDSAINTKVNAIDMEAMQRVSTAIEHWIELGGYLQSGLKLPSAAEEIGVPRYQLSSWLKMQGKHYSDWITYLRINEAKRILKKNREWSNEAVAQHCGFSDRSYFQKKFKESTGMTPADYLLTLTD